jgi:hypothetical protein
MYHLAGRDCQCHQVPLFQTGFSYVFHCETQLVTWQSGGVVMVKLVLHSSTPTMRLFRQQLMTVNPISSGMSHKLSNWRVQI